MSKSLQITVYTKQDFCCCARNIVSLLSNTGWSITDSDGRVSVLNEMESQWEYFSGTAEEFLKSNAECWFYIYNGLQIAQVLANSDNSFTISTQAYAQKISSDSGTHFDLNWYYEHIVTAFNKNEIIVERVVFDEY